MWRTAFLCALLFTRVSGAGELRDMTQYVGNVPRRDFNQKEFAEQLQALENAWNDGTCSRTEGRCSAGEEVLRQLYGSVYFPEWPHLLLYYKKPAAATLAVGGSEAGKATQSQPWRPPRLAAAVLLWNKKATPHFYGVHDIWVVVVAEESLKLRTDFVALQPAWVNPFEGLLSVIGGGGAKAAKAGATAGGDSSGSGAAAGSGGSQQNTGKPMGGREITLRVLVPDEKDADKTNFWYGSVGFVVPEDTVNRITVWPVAEDTGKLGNDKDAATQFLSANVLVEKEAENRIRVRVVTDPTKEKDPTKKKETIEVKQGSSVNANFANSPEARIGWSIAVGGLFRPIEQTISPQSNIPHASTHHFGAYLLGKIYVPFFGLGDGRPRLQLRSTGWPGRGYRPSFALVAGTNLSSSIFNDVALGVSFGHIVSRLGVVGGWQFIGPRSDLLPRRQQAGFWGFDYSF